MGVHGNGEWQSFFFTGSIWLLAKLILYTRESPSESLGSCYKEVFRDHLSKAINAKALAKASNVTFFPSSILIMCWWRMFLIIFPLKPRKPPRLLEVSKRINMNSSSFLMRLPAKGLIWMPSRASTIITFLKTFYVSIN